MEPSPITTMIATHPSGIFRTFDGNTNTTTHGGNTNTTTRREHEHERRKQHGRDQRSKSVFTDGGGARVGGRRCGSTHVALVERNSRPKKQRKTITFKVAALMARDELGG